MNVVIEKFKKKTKDPFVMAALSTQAVNNYLFIWFLQENCKLSSLIIEELLNVCFYWLSDEEAFAISGQMSVSRRVKPIVLVCLSFFEFSWGNIIALPFTKMLHDFLFLWHPALFEPGFKMFLLRLLNTKSLFLLVLSKQKVSVASSPWEKTFFLFEINNLAIVHSVFSFS